MYNKCSRDSHKIGIIRIIFHSFHLISFHITACVPLVVLGALKASSVVLNMTGPAVKLPTDLLLIPLCASGSVRCTTSTRP